MQYQCWRQFVDGDAPTTEEADFLLMVAAKPVLSEDEQDDGDVDDFPRLANAKIQLHELSYD